MAKLKKKSKKQNKKKNVKRSIKNAQLSTKVLSAGFFTSVGIITVLAFVSFELALICLGFLAIGGYIIHAVHQRVLWERAANFKFMDLKESSDKVSHLVRRNNDDIELLKRALETSTIDLSTAKKGFRPKAPPSAQPRPLLSEEKKPLSVPPKKKKTAKKKTPIAANTDMTEHNDGLSDMVVRELVHSAVRNKRVDIFVQPIVRLPQRQTKFYEVFGRVRARAGMYLPAERYMELAKEDKLLHGLDSLLLIECIKAIRETAHINRAAPFFINITSATITNANFMKKLLYFISNHRKLAPRLVFEIRQDDFENMHPAVLEILRGLGTLGCSLSIDHVQTLDFDIKFLQVLKVRFVKIKAQDLLTNIKDTKDFLEMQRLKRKLEGNGVGFIVERVEDEKDLIELLDYGINYGQGYLFGRPALQSSYQKNLKKSA